MLYIRTLGESEITIGSERIGADRPTSFALLFVLAMRGAIPSSRRKLASLLWPDASDADQNHRFRSLLHRLRRLGAPLTAVGSTVVLAEQAVVDFRAFVATPRSIEDVHALSPSLGPVLPNPPRTSSALLADLLDDERDVIVATVSRWLTAALALARNAGDWPLVEQLARAHLQIDGSSEDAWLTLAESQCLTASSEEAVRTLNEYRMRVSDGDASGRALLLRRRLELEHEGDESRELPLVGREDIMRQIWSAISAARAGRGSALLLWGPNGIGKTRILDEVERAVPLVSVRMVRATASPVHALMTYGFPAMLVRLLVEEPGAAGCEPEAYALMRSLPTRPTTPNDLRDAPAIGELCDAFLELVGAITDESPLVVAIDDAHWVDAQIWRFMCAVLGASATQRIVWLIAYRAVHELEMAHLPNAEILQRVPLRRLGPAAAAALADWLLGDAITRERHRERLLNSAGGHPLFLVEGARCGKHGGELATPAVRAMIDEWLTRLPDRTVRTLQLLAALDGSTVDSLASAAFPLLSRSDLITSVGELERAGIVRDEGGLLRAYTLWSTAALARLSVTERRMLEDHVTLRGLKV